VQCTIWPWVTTSCSIDFGSGAEWAGAIATLLAVLVALFQEPARRWFNRPRLKVSVNLRRPDCAKTTFYRDINPKVRELLGEGPINNFDHSLPVYYLRIWIQNIGRGRAENVEVYASRLFKETKSDSFQQVDDFLPMNLTWAHGRPVGPVILEGISRKMGHHCDLGWVADPERSSVGGTTEGKKKTSLVLTVEAPPNTGSHILSPGTYRLELLVAGSNAARIAHVIQIRLAGEWFDTEEQMFLDGIGLNSVRSVSALRG
jgi:hypothetical protein